MVVNRLPVPAMHRAYKNGPKKPPYLSAAAHAAAMSLSPSPGPRYGENVLAFSLASWASMLAAVSGCAAARSTCSVGSTSSLRADACAVDPFRLECYARQCVRALIPHMLCPSA